MNHRAGLCTSCRHVRVVASERGSTFYLCGAAASHPWLAKYPRLPVLSCPLYEHDADEGGDPTRNRQKPSSSPAD